MLVSEVTICQELERVGWRYSHTGPNYKFPERGINNSLDYKTCYEISKEKGWL